MEYFATVADKRFILDWDKLPEVSRERIIRYGVQRIINDRCGGSDKTPEAKWVIADEMCKNLRDGTVATRGNGGVDPVLIESRLMALKAWCNGKDQAKNDKRIEALKAMDAAQRAAQADKVIAAQSAEWQADLAEAAKAAVAKREAEKAAKRKAADKIAAAMGDVDI